MSNNQKFEAKINDVLTGDTLKNALDFAAFLSANEMIVNGAEVSHDDMVVCYMHIDGKAELPGPWTIWTDGDYSSEPEDFTVDEHLKEIARANVNKCADCGAGCSPGKCKVIFGKEIDNVCGASMAFNNPDTATLECVKRLLEMRKHVNNM